MILRTTGFATFAVVAAQLMIMALAATAVVDAFSSLTTKATARRTHKATQRRTQKATEKAANFGYVPLFAWNRIDWEASSSA